MLQHFALEDLLFRHMPLLRETDINKKNLKEHTSAANNHAKYYFDK